MAASCRAWPTHRYPTIQKGIRILCNAGADPHTENQINIPMLDFCSGYGSLCSSGGSSRPGASGDAEFVAGPLGLDVVQSWRHGRNGRAPGRAQGRREPPAQNSSRLGTRHPPSSQSQVTSAPVRRRHNFGGRSDSNPPLFVFLPSDAVCISRTSCCCSSSLLSTSHTAQL